MRNIRVLVADDESTVRMFFRTVISKEQLPVAALAEAENGLDAVRLAREFSPDLIFLDIRMPGLDGLQAAEIILTEHPGTNVVIVSAYSEFDYARTAFRTGVADYLLKPVKPGDVGEFINKVAAQDGPAVAAESKPPEKRSVLEKAVADYVAANADKPIKLRDIARAVFVSPCHLSRTFKHLSGQSIMDYVQERRLSKAEKLLATTDLSVTEVAVMVGFNDASYFTTCFKNKTGIPPVQYRKMQEIKSK